MTNKRRTGAAWICGVVAALALMAAGAQGAAGADSVTHEGTIKSADAKANSFVLQHEQQTQVFTVNDKTVITINGKAATFADALKPDAKVTVTFTREGANSRLVTKVNVTALAPAGAGADAATRPAKAGDYVISKTFKIGGEGLWEQYVGLDPDGKTLYVARQGRTDMVDTATGKVVGEVGGKAPSRGVAVVPEVGRGFITNGRENTVTVFDLKTFATLGKIAMDGSPDQIVYDAPSKHVLVACGEGRIVVPFPADIDLKTGKPEAAIELNGKPTGMVSDGQGTVYVSIFDTDEIGVIDTKTMSLLTKWPLGNSVRPTGLAYDPSKAWLFTGLRTMRLLVLSTVDGHEIDNVQIPGQSPVETVGFGGGKAFALCANGDVSVIAMGAAGKYELLQTIKTGEASKAMAVDGKTGAVYVVSADVDAARRPVKDSFKVEVLEKK